MIHHSVDPLCPADSLTHQNSLQSEFFLSAQCSLFLFLQSFPVIHSFFCLRSERDKIAKVQDEKSLYLGVRRKRTSLYVAFDSNSVSVMPLGVTSPQSVLSVPLLLPCLSSPANTNQVTTKVNVTWQWCYPQALMQVEHSGTGAASGQSMERGVIKMQQGTIQDGKA